MFGSGEEFEYLECARCGCLQIAAIPTELAKHYPREDYYSYKPPKRKVVPAWLRGLRRERTRYFLGEFAPVGAVLGLLSRRSEHFDWFRGRGVALDSRIVDIGCGAGALLLKLHRDGFRSLLGADPFIESDIDYGNGVRILKRGIGQLDGQFDFVMLHHSFEHMQDPAATLAALAPRLAAHGTLLLRIPVADSFARRTYGTHWVQWDAPRHLYLHTVKSMQRLAAAAGMEVTEVAYDSSGRQFSGSELYIRGIPYVEHGKYRPGNGPGAFSQEEWDRFARQAKELNRRREGDSACFYLRMR